MTNDELKRGSLPCPAPAPAPTSAVCPLYAFARGFQRAISTMDSDGESDELSVAAVMAPQDQLLLHVHVDVDMIANDDAEWTTHYVQSFDAPHDRSAGATAYPTNERTSLLPTVAPLRSSSTPFVGRRPQNRNSAAPSASILKPSSFRTKPSKTHKQTAAPSYHKSFSIDVNNRRDDSFNANPYETRYPYSSEYSYQQLLLKRLSYGILALVCTVYAVAISRGHTPRGHAPHVHHDHTIPTLLAVRHNEHGHFINALHSGLYQGLKAATYHNTRKERLHAFESYGSDGMSLRGFGLSQDSPRLTVDKGSVTFGQSLTVQWEGHKRDRHGYQAALGDKDVIALYCPSNESDPRKFRDVARLSDAQQTTRHLFENDELYKDSGRKIPENEWHIHSFPTIRADTCEFRLWLRSEHRDKVTGQHQYSLAATTGPFFVKHGTTTPTSLHLALGNEPNEMVASFATGRHGEGVPVVQYGKHHSRLHQTARGETSTYTAADLCNSPANITEVGKFLDPGALHHVTMLELEPDTEYYYRVGLDRGADRTVHWSEISKFVSSPNVGSNPGGDGKDTKPYKYVVYADQGAPGYGSSEGTQRISRWAKREVEEHGIRAVHHFGDLSYANGAAHMWDSWMDMVSSFARRVPLMVGVGNHEYDHLSMAETAEDPSGLETTSGFQPEWGNFKDDSAGECGVPTSRRFKMPDRKSGGNGVYWYSFDHGLVHTIMISSEHDLSPGSRQYKWLERDLKSVDRSKTPFLIVESHRPLYNSEDVPANTVVSLAMRDEIEDLLFDYDVDMFLAGHYHAYLRTCAGLYQSKCNNGGPVHMTVGSAGAELDQYPLYEQDWTDIYLQEWGYGRVTVHNRTALQFEFIAEKDGKVRDEYWVRKTA